MKVCCLDWTKECIVTKGGVNVCWYAENNFYNFRCVDSKYNYPIKYKGRCIRRDRYGITPNIVSEKHILYHIKQKQIKNDIRRD
jgi:hypothetical protein